MTRKSVYQSVAAGFVALVAGGGMRAASIEQATVAAPPAEDARDVDVEVYEAARIADLRGDKYPDSDLHRGYEGWVNLNFMVDREGKAYEISVVDSLGGIDFERNAIWAIKSSVFVPAKLDGRPVESGSQLKLRFAIKDLEKGAASDFVAKYRKLVSSVEAGDRKRADTLLSLLTATNLYEDAYRNLGFYQYHVKWGTEDEQLADLKGAIAGEGTARYLEQQDFISALNSRLKLEVKRRDLGQALATWRTLARFAPQNIVDAWTPLMAKVYELQGSHTPLRLAGEITKGTSWFNHLFRRRFEVIVLSGQIAEIKLRCAKRYVFFRYEPKLQYTVGKRDGDCSVELIGDHGTRFELIQT